MTAGVLDAVTGVGSTRSTSTTGESVGVASDVADAGVSFGDAAPDDAEVPRDAEAR